MKTAIIIAAIALAIAAVSAGIIYFPRTPADVSSLQRENVSLSQTLEQTKQKFSDTVAQQAELHAEIAELERQVAEASENLSLLEAINESLQGSIGPTFEDNKRLNKEVADLSVELAQLRNQISADKSLEEIVTEMLVPQEFLDAGITILSRDSIASKMTISATVGRVEGDKLFLLGSSGTLVQITMVETAVLNNLANNPWWLVQPGDKVKVSIVWSRSPAPGAPPIYGLAISRE